MKKKLLSFVAFLCAVTAWGQEDVTSTYLTNADLSSLDGWTFESTRNNDHQNDYENYKTDGDVPVVEFYHTWSGNAGAAIGTTYEFSATQTVTLPAGDYRIAVNAFYREGNGNGTNTKAYIFAGEQQQYIVGLSSAGVAGYTGSNDLYRAANAFSQGNFSNAFDFTVETEGEITLGFKGYMDTYCSWCILGPVKLYKYSVDAYLAEYRAVVSEAENLYDSRMSATVLIALKAAVVDEAGLTTSAMCKEATANLKTAVANAKVSIAAYERIAKALADVKATREAATLNVTAENEAVYQASYSALEEAYNDGAIEDAEVDAKVAEINNALATLVKSQPEGSDMTLAIVNPSFETGNADGWNVISSSDTGARTNTGNYVTEGIDGDYLFNTWWQGTPITQTITGLPNGKYRMDVLVSSDGATIYLIANGEHNEGTETGGSYPSSDVFQEASFEFMVTDGTATIGVVGGADGTAGEHKEYQADGCWWYKADNFRLTYLERGLGIVSSSLTEGESIEKFAEDEVLTLSTNMNDEINTVTFGIYDNTAGEYLCNMCGMTQQSDGSFSYEFPMDYVLYEGHEYKVVFTCTNETKDNDGYLTVTEVGTIEVAVNGASKPFEFSTVQNTAITPSVDTKIAAEETTVTLAFDAPVEVDPAKTFINIGQGVTYPFSSTTSNEEKTEWSFVVPAEQIAGKTILTLSFGFVDTEGNVVKGNEGTDASSYFFVEYGVESNAAYSTVDLTVSPSSQTTVEELRRFVLTFDDVNGMVSWINDETALAEGVVLTTRDGRTTYPVTTTFDWDLGENQLVVELGEPITEAGSYMLQIAEGMAGDDSFILGEGGVCNAGLICYYTVGTSSEITITPAEGTVESLKEFTIGCEAGFDVSWNGTIKLYDANDNVLAEITGDDVTVDYPESWDELATTASFELPEAVTAAGIYSLVIPDGFFIVGSASENSSYMTVLYTIEGGAAEADLVPTAVDPENNAEVSSVYTISLTFAEEIVKGEGLTIAPTLVKDGNENIPVTAMVTGNQMKLMKSDYDFITEAGTYVLTIPAGCIGDMNWAGSNGLSGHCNGELVYTFTIVENAGTETAYDLVPVNVIPAEGNVSASDLKNNIRIECDVDIWLGSWYGVMKLYEKESKDELAFNCSEVSPWNSLEIALAEETLLEVGKTYVLEIPEGVFGDEAWRYDKGGHANPALTYEFTVERGNGIAGIAADAAKVDVYTLNGVLVLKNADRAALKNLKKGIYIVNGKKVVLK